MYPYLDTCSNYATFQFFLLYAIVRGCIKWLRDYTTNRKVAGSIPDEVLFFFSIYLILPDTLGPGVYPAYNRNEHQKQK
jgi:hypothetical protein